MAKNKNSTEIKFRLPEEEKMQIQARAMAFFNGNVSEFIRHCCKTFKKKK